MTGIIVCSVIVYLFIWFLAGMNVYSIAKMKGHCCEQKFWECKYFWWTFICSIIGILLVIALPDRKDVKRTDNVANNDLPEI